MTAQETEKILNTKLELDSAYEGDDCRILAPPDVENDYWFMLHQGRIVRMNVSSSQHSTLSGIRIGDSESRVKVLYKGLYKIDRHHYDPTGHYITVYPKSKKYRPYALRFETDGKKVTNFYAGLESFIYLVEGCS